MRHKWGDVIAGQKNNDALPKGSGLFVDSWCKASQLFLHLGCPRPKTLDCCACLLLFCLGACSDQSLSSLEGSSGFAEVIFVQRPRQVSTGGLIEPSLPVVGANAYLLQPAMPTGKKIRLTDLVAGDILGLDIADDPERVVLAIRHDATDASHIYKLDLEQIKKGEKCFEANGDLGLACQRLTFGPADDSWPLFLPDGRISFVRSDVMAQVDFQGRGASGILVAIEPDGSGLTRLDYGRGQLLGTRVLRDGTIRAVSWSENQQGQIFRPVLIDPVGIDLVRPIGPLAGVDSLPLNVVQEANSSRTFATCTPIVGTFESGTICQLDDTDRFRGALDSIPIGFGCSPVGRIRESYPVSRGRFLTSLASVSHGCLDRTDDDRGLQPDLSLDVLDRFTGERFPIFNDPDTDELMVRPVLQESFFETDIDIPQRPEIDCLDSAFALKGYVGQSMLDSGAVRVRVLQAISAAEAPFSMDLFGIQVGAVCTDQSATDYSAPIFGDGSFHVKVPSQVPLRLQVLDAYGAALASDPIWRGGPACAQHTCNGCHQNDGKLENFSQSAAANQGAADLWGAQGSQRDFRFTRDIQPILDRSCATSGCHDANTAAGVYVDLSGRLRGLDLHAAPRGPTSVAFYHLTTKDVLRDSQGNIVEQLYPYVAPGQAKDSRLVQRWVFAVDSIVIATQLGLPGERRDRLVTRMIETVLTRLPIGRI